VKNPRYQFPSPPSGGFLFSNFLKKFCEKCVYLPQKVREAISKLIQEEIKVKFKLELRRSNIPEEELIADLKRVARKLKKNSLTCYEYEKYGKFSQNPFHRRFGSWSSALQKAGLRKTRNFGIPDTELFENLKKVWTKLRRQPRKADMRKPLSRYSPDAYIYRFGNWTNALKMFVELADKGGLKKLKNDCLGFQWHKTRKDVSFRLRIFVLQRDNYRCRLCGRSPVTDPDVSLHIDHIKPRSCGGETVPENLQTLCSECNLGKSNLKSPCHK